MTPDVLNVLGPGDFLLRAYRTENERTPYNELFIAYFPSQRTGDTIHSPKNCLPGAGWAPVESTRVPLSVPGQAPFIVNRYVIAKGGERQLVLYWYWAHDRAVASEYWAKIYLVTDSIRMNRSDGSLVRLTTHMFPGESVDAAMQRLVPFAGSGRPLAEPVHPPMTHSRFTTFISSCSAHRHDGPLPCWPGMPRIRSKFSLLRTLTLRVRRARLRETCS